MKPIINNTNKKLTTLSFDLVNSKSPLVADLDVKCYFTNENTLKFFKILFSGPIDSDIEV